MFTTRNVVSNTTCIPYQESGSNIDLRFETFTAPPAKKQPGAKIPRQLAGGTPAAHPPVGLDSSLVCQEHGRVATSRHVDPPWTLCQWSTS